jgi:hypothetical protein
MVQSLFILLVDHGSLEVYYAPYRLIIPCKSMEQANTYLNQIASHKLTAGIALSIPLHSYFTSFILLPPRSTPNLYTADISPVASLAKR